MAVYNKELKDAIRNNLSYDELLETVLETLCPDEIAVLSNTLKSNSEAINEDDEQFASSINEGQTYSKKEKAKLELETLLHYFKQRHKLLEEALSPAEVALILNTTRQTPHDRRNSGTLLAIQDNGVWKFPSWQFDAQGPNGVVDGLPEVLKSMNVSDFSKLTWLASANSALKARPIDALKSGRKQQVIAEAQALGVI